MARQAAKVLSIFMAMISPETAKLGGRWHRGGIMRVVRQNA
jgi:hypothetical protein